MLVGSSHLEYAYELSSSTGGLLAVIKQVCWTHQTLCMIEKPEAGKWDGTWDNSSQQIAVGRTVHLVPPVQMTSRCHATDTVS